MPKTNNFHQATLRDMLALEFPVNVRVSGNGKKVAFTVRKTNWMDNRYESHCYVYGDVTGATHPLTRHGDVKQLEWVNDETVALLKANGEKAQVFLFEGAVVECYGVVPRSEGDGRAR